jgi:hypothetical protein
MRRSDRSHLLLACWLLLGLGARVLVPSGFMLAPIAADWPVVPCPGQSHGSHPAGAMPEGHEGHGDESCDADCYQGLFFALAADVEAVDSAPEALPEVERLAAVDVVPAALRTSDSPRPRGPPTSSAEVA